MDSTTSTKWQSHQSNSQMKNISLQVLKNWFSTIIFTAGYAGHSVLNKDPTLHLIELDLPTPVSYPHSWSTACTAMQHTHKQKYVCEPMKMDVCKSKIMNLTYLLQLGQSNQIFVHLENSTTLPPTTSFGLTLIFNWLDQMQLKMQTR